ncbi:hypothetical protein FisN_33Lu023 [Fistulifera solaris]|uniref:Uncharacterized protein n=1 Tax=Fistulifera solaris TaxID=1519565 RepID=A0A1Z5KAD8_FISSO|nr:hypothetical protein FisN_33Lu023 [Fistulifera solaris]|eukprot:GAX23132.1 hypothetical protein FisN_33Lu023 [Fistulifera solaris]
MKQQFTFRDDRKRLEGKTKQNADSSGRRVPFYHFARAQGQENSPEGLRALPSQPTGFQLGKALLKLLASSNLRGLPCVYMTTESL